MRAAFRSVMLRLSPATQRAVGCDANDRSSTGDFATWGRIIAQGSIRYLCFLWEELFAAPVVFDAVRLLLLVFFALLLLR